MHLLSMWTLVLTLLCLVCSSARAAEPWPKELKDHHTSGCVAQWIGGVEIGKKTRRTIEKACACISDEYETYLSVDRLRETISLSPEEQDSLPENDRMRASIDKCNKRFHVEEALQTEAENYAKKPISSDVRESFLLECAISNAEEVKALADGAAKLSAACICLADDLLPKLRTAASETTYQEIFDLSWTKCRQEHKIGK